MQNNDINIVEIRAMTSTCAASSEVLGNMIANSYRRQAITPIIDVIEAKIAAIPQASGEKRRVMIGVVKMLMPCAKAEPVASFKTLLAKLLDGFEKDNNFMDSEQYFCLI